MFMMKIVNLILFLLILSVFSLKASIPERNDLQIISKIHVVIPGYCNQLAPVWIWVLDYACNSQSGPIIGSLICCCEDGNQRFFSTQTYIYTCHFGGFIWCNPGTDCITRQSDCASLCGSCTATFDINSNSK